MLACGKVSEGPFWSCGFFCLVLPWLGIKSLGQGLECQVKYWLYIDVLISGVQRENTLQFMTKIIRANIRET